MKANLFSIYSKNNAAWKVVYFLGFSTFSASYNTIVLLDRYSVNSSHFSSKIITLVFALSFFFLALKNPALKERFLLCCGSILCLFGLIGLTYSSSLSESAISFISPLLVNFGHILCTAAWVTLIARFKLRTGLGVFILSLGFASLIRLIFTSTSLGINSICFSTGTFIFSIICFLLTLLCLPKSTEIDKHEGPMNTKVSNFLTGFASNGYIVPFALRIPTMFSSSLILQTISQYSSDLTYASLALAAGATIGGFLLFFLWVKKGVLLRHQSPLVATATLLSLAFFIFILSSSTNLELKYFSLAITESCVLVSVILSIAVFIEGSQLKIASAAALSAAYFIFQYPFSNAGAYAWNGVAAWLGETTGTFALIAFGLIFFMLAAALCQAAFNIKKESTYVNFLFDSLETPSTTIEFVAQNKSEHAEKVPTDLSKFQERFGLSSRETEVLSLLVQGTTAPYIAKAFFISEATVRTHIRNIYRKTDIHKKNDLVALYESVQKEV